MADHTLEHSTVHQLLQYILDGDTQSLEAKLRQLSKEEYTKFFDIYQPLDLAIDHETVKVLSSFVTEFKISPKINGLGLLNSIRIKNFDLVSYWMSLFNKAGGGIAIVGPDRVEKIKKLLEKSFLENDERITGKLIDFFEKQKITPTFSTDFWDTLSRRGLRELSNALDAVKKLSLPLTIPSNFSDYEETVRQKWLLFLTERVHM